MNRSKLSESDDLHPQEVFGNERSKGSGRALYLRRLSHGAECVDAVLDDYPAVQAIYLFGSWGTVPQRPDSDMDVALLLPFETARYEKEHLPLSRCAGVLADVIGASIDLVNLRCVSTVFQNEILASGRRIYTGDFIADQEFEMLVLSFYQKLNRERAGIIEEIRKTGRIY